MKQWLPIWVLAILLLCGCGPKPSVGDLIQHGQGHSPVLVGTPRPCRLKIEPILDSRPIWERDDRYNDQSSIRYFVPLLVWTLGSSAGPYYGKSSTYDTNFSVNFRSLLNKEALHSNVCNETSGPTIKVTPRLLHYTNVSYLKTYHQILFLLLLGYGTDRMHSFNPLGWVDLELDVKREDGLHLGTLRLQEQVLSNQDTTEARYDQDTGWISGMAVEQALSRAMTRWPTGLEAILAKSDGSAKHFETPDTVDFVRFEKDPHFARTVRVDRHSGNVISDVTAARILPLVSEPMVWFVSPLGPDKKWMGTGTYLELVRSLSGKWNLDTISSGNVARLITHIP